VEANVVGSAVHGSPSVDSVEIPAEIAEALESLPDRNSGRKMGLEPWQDEVLRKYWRVKRKADIAQMLGICEAVLRRRAEELGL